jgi:trimethylamine--corrinoid protein Co-methyltransferase
LELRLALGSRIDFSESNEMQITTLTQEEEDRIHESALEILEEIGLQVESPALASELKKRGFPSPAADRILFPRARVESALKDAPRSVRLGARAADRQAVLDGSRTFVATSGCGSKTLDMVTDEVRPASLADVAASARLVDSLDQFDIYWTMISPQDVDASHSVARGYLAALQNTCKPIQVIDAGTGEEAETLVRMTRALESAGAVHGPPLSMLNSVVTPLRLDPGGTEAALVFARESLPVVCCSMPLGGVTSPATSAGTVMLAHSEVMAFATLLQSFHPGSPLIYCCFPVFGDTRLGIANYLDPRSDWMACAALQLGRRTGLPCFGGSVGPPLIAGPDLCGGGGMLEVYTVLSFEQLVIDNGMMRNAKIAAVAQDTGPESLAMEVVRAVGPGGHFLAQRHTLEQMRKFPTAGLATSLVDIFYGGRGDAESVRQQAREEARRLIETHEVEALPAELESELLEIAGGKTRAAVP